MTGLLTEKMKEGRKAVERVMERTEKSLRIAFDDYAGACDGAAEHLALQLAQAHYELDLAKAQAADLAVGYALDRYSRWRRLRRTRQRTRRGFPVIPQESDRE